MNTSKVKEYFDAYEMVKAPIHVIGCGAIGSHVSEQLARLGCTNIHLWDFDKVEPKNIANQMFFEDDIGKLKVDAVEDLLKRINSKIEVIKHPEGINDRTMIVNGYIFLCVDNIDLRRKIVETNKMNPNCKCFLDFRMRLTDGQSYFADRRNRREVENLLNSMAFTSEEAKAATPVSACGVELSVINNVKAIVSVGINSFIDFCKGLEAKNTVLLDLQCMALDAFKI